ncbi:MAG: phage tail tape measure protein, partial [Ignavibacteria bacterium]|nr:phage tail tape measure protein [Ignavibacteria bacterium]
MANLVEVLLKAVDEVTPTIDKISRETAKASGEMQKNWAGTGKTLQTVGIAAAAVGVGLEALARANAPLLESTRRLADYLDMDSKAMQQLVIDTSNVTFPLKEVLSLMETGTKLGLDSADALQEYAKFWDMVGDATGESSTALAEAGVSLKALGIAAGEEGKALNAFGFIQKNTTMEIGEFIGAVGRLAPEMKQMGMGVNEAAVILGILQREMGMTSRTSLAEFRRAVTESDGDVEKLKSTLGITAEMFDTYSQKVAESSDVISENARRNNELYTPMQKIQHALSELKYRMGDFIAGAANYAPLLTGIGSAMTIVGTIMKSSFLPSILLATKAVWAFTASILANPLTFWIGVIGLVITSLVMLWKNWDNITEWISRKIDWIVDKFKWLGDGIKWVAEKLGIYKEKTIEIVEATDKLGESADKVNTSLDNMKTTTEEAGVAVGGLAEQNIVLGESFDGLPEKIAKATDAIKLYASDVGEDYIQLAGKATDSWADFYAFWEAEAKRTAGEINQTVTTVIDKMGVAHKVWTDIKDEVKTGKESNLYKQVSKEGKTLGLQTGNIISQAMKDEGVTLV